MRWRRPFVLLLLLRGGVKVVNVVFTALAPKKTWGPIENAWKYNEFREIAITEDSVCGFTTVELRVELWTVLYFGRCNAKAPLTKFAVSDLVLTRITPSLVLFVVKNRCVLCQEPKYHVFLFFFRKNLRKEKGITEPSKKVLERRRVQKIGVRE